MTIDDDPSIVTSMTTRPAVEASRATQIVKFLNRRRGKRFRCNEIAEKLGFETQQTASECGRLWRNGRVDRVRDDVEGRSQPITYYTAVSKP